MEKNGKTLLVVEDEEMNRDILEYYLEEEGYNCHISESASEAWDMLGKSDSPNFNCIILDRMMPGMSGVEFLSKIKASSRLKNIPVIMQTAATTSREVIEGIEAGAFHYLLKPYDPNVLLALIRSAVAEEENIKKLENEVKRKVSAITHMASGSFTFKTIKEAHSLSNLLAVACPNSMSVGFGLAEIMVNAIEHGNLGITYEEKTKLLLENNWKDEILKRQELPENSHKKATLIFNRFVDKIVFEIKDVGNGFKWQDYINFETNRIMDLHGRGIALANVKSFDSLQFLGNGNHVVATIKINKEEKE